MRILIISNIFPPNFIGGYELGALDFAQGLCDQGNDIHVLTSSFLHPAGNFSYDFTVDRCLSFYTNINAYTSAPNLLEEGSVCIVENIERLTMSIQNFKPDVVLCFHLTGIGTLSIISFLDALRIPTVLFCMDSIFASNLFYNNYSKYFEFFPEWNQDYLSWCFLSKNVQYEIEHSAKLSFKRSYIIQNHHSLKVRCDINKSQKRLSLIFSSRVCSHKGIFILLDALSELQNYVQDFQLDIYGDGEIEQVRRHVCKLGLDSKVNFMGCVSKDELTVKYKEYSILPLPTWHREPGPYVVAEAAACGCIPVVSGGVGAAEFFIHEFDCVKCNRDSHSFAQALFKLYNMPDDEFNLLRKRAQDTAFNSFLFSKCLAMLENVIALLPKSEKYINNVSTVEASTLSLYRYWKERCNYV